MDFLADSALMGSISLLFFVIFFVGVLAWVFRPGAKEKYRELGHIPLNDEPGGGDLPGRGDQNDEAESTGTEK
jgi:cbb3-type cytochrome oxidase subunit 3